MGLRASVVCPPLRNMMQCGKVDGASAFNMLKKMVAQGFQTHNSYIGFLAMINHLHYETAQVVIGGAVSDKGAKIMIAFSQKGLNTFFKPKFNFAVHMGDVAASEVAHFMLSMRTYGIKDTAQAIYISSHYEITRHLLEKGADPNQMTAEKLTPIDCWVRDIAERGFSRGYRNIVSSITVITEHGGCLNVYTRMEWDKLVQPLNSIRVKAPSFPEWLDEAPGADGAIYICANGIKRYSRNLLKIWKHK